MKWAIKHKSGRVLFVTSDEFIAENRREMGWIVEEVKMTSREQFELCVGGTTNSDLHRSIMLCRHENGNYNHLATNYKLEAWQASRAAVEKGSIVAYQDFYGNAISAADFDGGEDEMHETAFNEQWTPLIKADGLKVKK
ncbi:hypothetical protein [Salmonella enterica]|uniref:hypothetical protein n=1 Tax=Salmonella enterica TaxID=28901 RepID=UPI001889EDA4|nr:hypothetical protein [Salmonella enterica]MBF4541137.1 hypothetical protein [Salmonella enterica subsp. enterica serovar Typhimurium]